MNEKRITDLEIIYHFHGKYGVYKAKFRGDIKVFVRNENSVGVVSHQINEPVSKCLLTVCDDVRDELLELVETTLGRKQDG